MSENYHIWIAKQQIEDYLHNSSWMRCEEERQHGFTFTENKTETELTSKSLKHLNPTESQHFKGQIQSSVIMKPQESLGSGVQRDSEETLLHAVL